MKVAADGVAAGDLRALGMAKTSVAGLQFGQEILYLLLEFFIVGALEDLVSPGFRQLFPIRPFMPGSKCFRATSSQTRE